MSFRLANETNRINNSELIYKNSNRNTWHQERYFNALASECLVCTSISLKQPEKRIAPNSTLHIIKQKPDEKPKKRKVVKKLSNKSKQIDGSMLHTLIIEQKENETPKRKNVQKTKKIKVKQLL
jgi:hypothetical protein